MALSILNDLISTVNSDIQSDDESSKIMTSDELAVLGYVRSMRQKQSIIPSDIVNIILKFYLLQLNSSILTSIETDYLLNMLKKAIPDLDSIKYEFVLLFHGKQANAYDKDSFDEACINKSPTFAIVYTEYKNQVFGGFTNVILKSYKEISPKKVLPDPSMESFIFVLRSDDNRFPDDNIPYKYYLKNYESAIEDAIYQSRHTYGYGADWVINFKYESSTWWGHCYDTGMRFEDRYCETFDPSNYEIWHIKCII